VVLAGAAGGRVLSAARNAARAAIGSGLWAAQRDDYPVTVKTGHSIATLVLDPEPIDDVTADPDVVVLLATEGVPQARKDAGRLGSGGMLVTLPDLPAIEHAGRTVVLDPAAAGMRLARTELPLAVMAAVVTLHDLFPIAALDEVVGSAPKGADRMREVVAAGVALAEAADGSL
jgi:Pyruvate/2-oxoacid:ferredoxin oxidoreductase gamma subunit